jgi:hypothetical protein
MESVTVISLESLNTIGIIIIILLTSIVGTYFISNEPDV